MSRIDAAAKREYIAFFNAGTSAARVTVATATGATTWTTLFGSPANVQGSLTLTVPALSSALVRATGRSRLRRPKLKVAGDGLTSFWRLSATAGSSRERRFRRAAQGQAVAAGRRRRLAAVPGFLDPAKFRRNEPVQLVAIARSLDGRVAVSKVMSFTVRRR